MTPKQIISSAARRAAGSISQQATNAHDADMWRRRAIEREFAWVERLIEALDAARITHYDCEILTDASRSAMSCNDGRLSMAVQNWDKCEGRVFAINRDCWKRDLSN